MRHFHTFVLSIALLSHGCGGTSKGFDSPLAARIEFLKTAHPALSRTLPADQLDAAVSDSLAQKPQHDLADAQVLRRVLASLGDSHLTSEIPLPSAQDRSFVPFLLKKVGEDYRVDACTDQNLVGEAVLAVDGIPVEELITRLAGLAGVDGARSEVQRDEAERRFAEFIRLELGPKSIWTLTVSDPETNVERVEPLQGTSVDAVGTLERARRSAPYWGERQALPSWSEEHSMLRLATFGTPERGAYLDAIENLATEFKSVDHLAIDLRGNEGGDRSLGIAVARHLLGQPFRQWTSVRTRVREIDDPFDEWVSFPFGSATALTEFPGDEVEDGWVVQGDPLSQMMVPHDGEFPGRITLLVDDATNSAAVEFAVSLLAHHPRVTVVGRETQGECAWHVGQLPVLFQDDQGPAMIASLFEIELVAYAGCRERRGIEPNIPVAYDESDFAEGIDPYLRAIQ